MGLVVPRHVEDVVAAVAACRKYGAPVLGRGAGTSLAAQCCNVAVVLDFTKYMNQIVELDPLQQYARVQPGVVLDSLRNKAEAYKLTFAPDPSTHNRCTIGGMIGNNSCGTHSLLGGGQSITSKSFKSCSTMVHSCQSVRQATRNLIPSLGTEDAPPRSTQN